MKSKIASLTAAASLVVASGVSAQTFVPAGSIAVDTIWSPAGSPFILEGAVFVNGGATLTIAPGTIIRGQPRTAAAVPGTTTGTPGSLIITQEGMIEAQGTAEEPIIFTTAATDNDGDGIADPNGGGFFETFSVGDTFLDADPANSPLAPLNAAGEGNESLWGGLVVLGQAPTNLGGQTGAGGSPIIGSGTIEGLVVPGFPTGSDGALYGGEIPGDNSGTLSFLEVRHGGDTISDANEINGVTLGGVGFGTTLNNVSVYCNFDDGVEWFGGTVNSSNLAVFFAGDDSFDLDQGFTGVNQFWLAVLPFFTETGGGDFGSGSGDSGWEFDGNDAGERGGDFTVRTDARIFPLSNPIVFNATVLGHDPDEAGSTEFTPNNGSNRLVRMRNGFAGQTYNSLFLLSSRAAGAIEVQDDDELSDLVPPIPGQDTTDNAVAGLILFAGCTVEFVTNALDTNAAGASTAEEISFDNGDAIFGGALPDFGANIIDGVNNASGAPVPPFAGLVNADTTFLPTGTGTPGVLNGTKATPLNPRPAAAGGFGISTNIAPFGPGTVSAAFRGAHSPSAAIPLFTTGWTAANIGGILAD